MRKLPYSYYLLRWPLTILAVLILLYTGLLLWPSQSHKLSHIHKQRGDIRPEIVRPIPPTDDHTKAAPLDESRTPLTPSGSTPDLSAESSLCIAFGPFLSRGTLDRAIALVKKHRINPIIKKGNSERIVYFRVYSGPYVDSLALVSAVEVLQSRAYKEWFLRKESNTEQIISFGLFSNENNAENTLEVVQRLGVEAKIKEEGDLPFREYWYLYFRDIPQAMREDLRPRALYKKLSVKPENFCLPS